MAVSGQLQVSDSVTKCHRARDVAVGAAILVHVTREQERQQTHHIMHYHL